MTEGAVPALYDPTRGRLTRRGVLLFVAGWSVIGGFGLATYAAGAALRGAAVDGWRLVQVVLAISAWMLYTPGIVWAAARWPIGPTRLWRTLALHLALAIGCGVSDTIVSILTSALGAAPTVRAVLLTFAGEAPGALFGYFAVLGIGSALRYHHLFLERRLRAAELERARARVRLSVLEAQVRPHFLFNALHSVGALVRTGEGAAAARTVDALADLLGAAIGDGEANEIPLREELRFIERYLDIERTRHGDRLTTRVEIPPGLDGALVPRFVLQPLVENAVRHGVEPRDGPARIEIVAAMDGEQLRIDVRDSGALPSRRRPGRVSHGIGLANARARLAVLYGARQRLELLTAPDGTVARLELPLRRAPAG
jgi:hypothetical protein